MSDIKTIPHLPEKDPTTGEHMMYVCHGLHCGRHAKYIMDRLNQVRAKGVRVRGEKCLCMGLCEKGPNVLYKGKVHHKMNPIKVAELAKQ